MFEESTSVFFRPVLAFSILIAVVFFLRKGNFTILAFPFLLYNINLGGQPILFLNFSWIYTIICYASILYLGEKKSNYNFKTKYNIYTFFLFIIILKIVAESFLYGLFPFRLPALIASQFYILMPMLILILSLRLKSFEMVIYEFCISGFVLSFLTTFILAIPIFSEQFILAITSGHRITFFGIDTINSARPFYYLVLFALSLIILKKNQNFNSILLNNLLINASIIIGVLFLLLTGTRQFLIGLIFVLILFNYGKILKSKLSSKVYSLSILLSFGILFLVNLSLFENLEIYQRLTNEGVKVETEEGRGDIWISGWNQMISNNWAFGLGFKNFGEEVAYEDILAGTKSSSISGAHGFFQEVFIEHGLLLGAFYIISLFYIIFIYNWRNNSPNNDNFLVLRILCFGLIIPTFFSGDILNSFGYYFLYFITSFMHQNSRIAFN